MDKIKTYLKLNSEQKLIDFQSKLMPTIDKNSVLGVRTQILKSFAKQIKNTEVANKFLNELPHNYFEENQLHAFLIAEISDFDKCIIEVDKFLPYVNNWATCDQLLPKIFAKNKDKLLLCIDKWLNSNQVYTVRFAIGMLMKHFLDDDFDVKYLNYVSNIISTEYYVNMEIAWYLATALAKQYDHTITILESKSINSWVQNKTIQKALESFRIPNDRKIYLKTLKI